MGNLRILLISSSFIPKIDGSVRVVHDLSRKLVQRGHEVYLLTRWFPDTPKLGDIDGIKVIRVAPARTSTMNRFLLWLNQTIVLARMLREHHFDLIHSHGCVPALVGLAGRVLRRVPLIVTFHGHQVLWPESLRWKKEILLKLELWLENVILRKADILIAQSARIRNLFVKMYGASMRKKIRIIPNGVDLDKFATEKCWKAASKSSSMVIFSVGTLSRIKGFDVLIKAMAMVSRVKPRARLIIAGGGPQRGRLEMLAEQLGVKDHVTFAGWLKDKELYEHYCMADVVVLPTRAEFFVLVLLEGMAMARPIISTRVIGPTEIIIDGRNGLLVEPDNQEQLAEAITSLISNRELAKKLGMNGRRIAEEKYSLERIVDSHEELYRLVSERTS